MRSHVMLFTFPFNKSEHQLGPWIISHFVLVLFILTFLFPATGFGAAFRIYDQSATGTGQSAAFTAQADDASAVYYNPAGMTQLPGLQLSLGTAIGGASTDFNNSAGRSTRGSFGGTIAFPPASNLYVTANLQDLGVEFLGKTTLGIGVLSPFGITYEYPNTAPFASAATRTSLELIDIKPTIAYQVNDDLSVGFGFDIYTFLNFWGEGQAETTFVSSGGTGLPPAGTNIEVNGSDTSLGFNVSLLYSALRNAEGQPIVNLGLVYRSEVDLSLDGNFLANGRVLTDSNTTLILPQVFTGGIAVWPVRTTEREWKVEFDVDYTDWKSFRNLDLHLSNGTTIQFPQNWSSTFTIMLGTEYRWLQPTILPHWDIAVRGGYWFSESPMPDLTYNPTFPADADNHALSIGASFLCKGQGRFWGVLPCGSGGGNSFWPTGIGLDLAYQFLFYEERTVSGATNPVAIPGVLNGTYDTTIHIGAVNLRLNF